MGEVLPDHPHDLNACARDLVREGYRVELCQLAISGTWLVYFKTMAGYLVKGTECENEQPAVAWCEAFLALQKYLKAKEEGL